MVPSSLAKSSAALQSAAETETDFGGRTRVWTTIASIWVTFIPGGASADTGQEQRPFRVETASASARDHPLAASDQQLLLDGPPWRVIAVQRTEPGRMTLILDRAL